MQKALATLQYVLREFAKVSAPFMPFVAERVFQRVRGDETAESVHLAVWPELQEVDGNGLLLPMKLARSVVSEALELRAREGVKVRQPLQKLTLGKSHPLKSHTDELRIIIADEVNVKEVVIDDAIDTLELDFTLTPELIAEGQFRELVRNIQSLRKEINELKESK